MNVLNTTLIAIGTMLGVVLLTVPYIVALKGWDAWQALPREVYDRHQQRIFHLRPIYLWIASAILDTLNRVFGWLRWSDLQNVTYGVSLALLAIVLVSHLIWAIRMIRVAVDIDERLRRFAQYALCGSAAGIILVATSLVRFVIV